MPNKTYAFRSIEQSAEATHGPTELLLAKLSKQVNEGKIVFSTDSARVSHQSGKTEPSTLLPIINLNVRSKIIKLKKK